MNRRTTMFVAAALLALTAGSAAAQRAPTGEPVSQTEPTSGVSETSSAEADRAVIRSFLEREDVRRAASMTGTDAGDLESRLEGLEGERLHRAADQIRALDLDDVVSLRVSTIIIILLVLIILLIAA